jgi:putative hemolysin
MPLTSFKPKCPFTIVNEDFIIHIADNGEDIRQAQKLRHQVFLEEWQGKSHESGLDFDDYDAVADHLMIIDQASKQLVGTYRLISSKFTDKFYSQSEFDLHGFLNQAQGNKLEMGRACTHKDFRNGRSMDLLWQGIAKYIALTQTRHLFGCSSVTTSDPAVMFSMLKSILDKNQLKFEYDIHPQAKYTWPNSKTLLAEAPHMDGYAKQLPPLLRSYLHAGSFIYGMPAYDKEFSCFDLLTILDLKALNKKFYARYAPEEGWGF